MKRLIVLSVPCCVFAASVICFATAIMVPTYAVGLGFLKACLILLFVGSAWVLLFPPKGSSHEDR